MRGLLRKLRFFHREEPPPPPLPYHRLIVICGMPCTGTSALAAYVGSHPEVRLVVGDGLWHRAESDIARDGDVKWELLDLVMSKLHPWRVLIKQPWLESCSEFFEKASGAKVIVCFRKPETLFESWYRSWNAGQRGRIEPQVLYDERIGYSQELVDAGALRIDNENVGHHLAPIIGEHLQLDPAGFDARRIALRWKGVDDRRWLMENAVWQPTK